MHRTYIACSLCVLAALPSHKAFSSDAPLPRVFLLNAASLAETKNRVSQQDRSVAMAVERLRKEADEALQSGPFSVVDNEVVPPSGDKHDYMSFGPYWWPDPKKPDGLPYIRRDGQTNPEGVSSDRRPLSKMISSVETLALAYYLTSHEPYAQHAALLLRVWFLDEATRMNPNLKFGQAIPGRTDGRGIGIIDTSSLTRLVDSIGLLENSSAWTEADGQGLVAWFRGYLDWLLKSKHGRDESRTKNNHGTWFDVQVASFALFTGDDELARDVIQQAKRKRIAPQIKPNGTQPHELARTRSWDYCVMNLRGMFDLAALGDRVGVDLWGFQTDDGRSIRRALDWLVPYAVGEKQWSHQQIRKIDVGKLSHLLRRAAIAYGDQRYVEAIVAIGGIQPDDRVNLLWPTSSGLPSVE